MKPKVCSLLNVYKLFKDWSLISLSCRPLLFAVKAPYNLLVQSDSKFSQEFAFEKDIRDPTGVSV